MGSPGTTPDPSVIGAPSAPNIADVLNRAADLIEPEGRWGRDDYGYYGPDSDSDMGCYCLIGAIAKAAARAPFLVENDDAIAAILGFKHGYEIPRWNDEPDRTQAEVVAALRAAAKLSEADNG
jgi:hypothetical protein